MARKPWHKLDRESAQQFAYFDAFKGMGAGRTMQALSEAEGKAYGTIDKASRGNEWKDRAEAYDAHLAAAEDDAVISEAQRRAVKHMAAWDDVLELGAKGASRLLERFDEPVECPACGEVIAPPYPPTPRETALLLEKATTFHRLIVGEATSRDEQRQTIDVDKLSQAGRDALRVVMDEIGEDEV